MGTPNNLLLQFDLADLEKQIEQELTELENLNRTSLPQGHRTERTGLAQSKLSTEHSGGNTNYSSRTHATTATSNTATSNGVFG